MADATGEQTAILIRLPRALLAAVDELASTMPKPGGGRVSREAAVREILMRATRRHRR